MHLLEMCCICDWMGRDYTPREERCCLLGLLLERVLVPTGGAVGWGGGGVYINSVCSAVVCVN